MAVPFGPVGVRHRSMRAALGVYFPVWTIGLAFTVRIVFRANPLGSEQRIGNGPHHAIALSREWMLRPFLFCQRARTPCVSFPCRSSMAIIWRISEARPQLRNVRKAIQ